MTGYSYDRTAATRREKLEQEIAGKRKLLDYIRTLNTPADVKAKAIARREAEIARLESTLSKFPPEKPKAVPFEFTNQPASEDTECLECGAPIDEGRREWWEESGEEALGPFCTRRCAQHLSALRRQSEG